MRTVQCLIADMPQAMLADILQHSVQQSGQIDIVGRIDDIDELPAALAKHPVDVLIVGMEKDSVPGIYSDLMRRFSRLAVVGLVDDGRSAAVFVNNISQADLTALITLLGQR